MNLVCFSNQTGGGILCDLLNGVQKSTFDLYHTLSHAHGAFKIGDSLGVFNTFDEGKWLDRVQIASGRWSIEQSRDLWVGTHCHPSCIPEKYLSSFNKVIAITTDTRHSKLLRFVRAYHGMFKMRGGTWDGPPLGYVMRDDLYYFTNCVDEIRTICHNTCMPFTPHLECVNVEFSELVNGNYVRNNDLDIRVFDQWKLVNPWLYTEVDPFLLNIFNEVIGE